MSKHIIIFCLFLITSIELLQAQEFYVCTGTGELRSVQVNGCTSQPVMQLRRSYGDITFHPSGKLYGVAQFGDLYEIDTISRTETLVFNLGTIASQTYNSLTADARGLIYATGSPANIVTYDPLSRIARNLGPVRVNGLNFGATGDLTFYRGDLYMASQSLIKIDLNNPANSSSYMPLNGNIFGIVSFVDCGNVTTYATSGSSSGDVFKIDWIGRTLSRVCGASITIFGGASRYEFNASNINLDTTRLITYTCNRADTGDLPKRVLTNRFGCDSVVLEKKVFVRSDTTRFEQTTCDIRQVKSDTLRLQNSRACDSLVITQVKMGNDSVKFSRNICSGDSVSFYNQWLKMSGNYTRNIPKTTGCDSVMVLQLTVWDKKTTVKDSFVCRPDLVGRDTLLLRNFIGCDSFSVKNRLIAPRLNDQMALNWQICRGDTARIGQNRFSTEGVFSVLLKNQFGCDSTVRLTLKLLRKDTTILRPETCLPDKVRDSVVVFKNQAGCDSTVFIKPRLIQNTNTVSNLSPKQDIVIGDSVVFTPRFNFLPVQIRWTPTAFLNCPNCDSVIIKPQKTVKITVWATDKQDCAVQQEVTILVNPNRRVFFPTVFAPNSTNMGNTFFTAFGDANLIRIETLEIFNRWGDKLYHATEIAPNTEGWNGKYNGQDTPSGIYVFWAKLRFKDGATEIFKGDITLVR
jgi:gliding motility-associated-like protein